MSKIFATVGVFAALFSQAATHTAVIEFEANGNKYPGFRQASKMDPGNNSPAWWTAQGWGWDPVMGANISHPDIIAHTDADPSPHTVDVSAGSQVKFTWFHEGECDGKKNETGWDCSHHGWTTTWMAPCDSDRTKIKKTELKFFKIHEVALIDYREGRYSNATNDRENVGYWGTDDIFYKNNNTQTVTIPKDIPDGDYVLRTEVTSIHNNGPLEERQFWPQAFNIKITGGKPDAQIPDGIVATEIYSKDDELLKWDLYQHDAGKTFDKAPGPELASVAKASSNERRRALKFLA
ncbi:lytic polysaccharide monooxygenase [Aaosphaeria arxii CBS 175.79]|uniref:Lytic polysaccharide monooxygenase n=1 Tax=Aaosphaeria arxii CBS 175.79 TaxID=1450172 RepID=A0A6A5Y7V0_9PLEO|nr:lytic polysaccharide monooxygenase [Aaosphaeria arxii CBS 175.79]KAF2021655.1 lytic polysaccharide monooxygenase [Aaosphaeria arxii CBS 175.79]